MFGITKKNGTYSVEVGTITITNITSIWGAINVKITGWQLPVGPSPYTDNIQSKGQAMNNIETLPFTSECGECTDYLTACLECADAHEYANL